MKGGKGGKAAEMEGNFYLSKGDILEILVGEHKNDENSTGGGGSFVFLNNDKKNETRIPLIVAGGGGFKNSASLSENGINSNKYCTNPEHIGKKKNKKIKK